MHPEVAVLAPKHYGKLTSIRKMIHGKDIFYEAAGFLQYKEMKTGKSKCQNKATVDNTSKLGLNN